MPLTDPSFWQEIAKWLAGIAATVLGLYGAAVKWWIGDRFKRVDERFVAVEEDIKEQHKTCDEHSHSIAEMTAHIEHSKDDRKAIHGKLDSIYNLLLKNGSGS